MSQATIDTLREEIQNVRRRRIVIHALRQISLVLTYMAALFFVVALAQMQFQFGPQGRATLLVLLVAGGGILFFRILRAIRKLRQGDKRLAHYVEDHFPELEQRLLTSMEMSAQKHPGMSSRLVETLWEDTLAHVQKRDIERVTSTRTALPAAVAVVITTAALVLALLYSTDFSQAGRHILGPWSGTQAVPALIVTPGHLKLKRGSDVTFAVVVQNASPKQVYLFLRKDGVEFSRVSMRQEGTQNAYAHYLSSVNADLSYYVDIGIERSALYRISVFDPPRVERIDVTYRYPSYARMEQRTEINGGDISAPEGTRIALRVKFNKPVQTAVVEFENGDSIKLTPDGSTAVGDFTVTEDTTYSVKALDHEQIPNDHPVQYLVRSLADRPPVLALIRPGSDRQVMALEEVTIAARATDDYGLSNFTLTYSLPGGASRDVAFFDPMEHRQINSLLGKAIIQLEDLSAKPGDIVTYYLTAADTGGEKASSAVTSDIYFLEVTSTENTFRRAPQMGGMGGGMAGQGQQSSSLVQNQKHIIAATWKLLKQRDTMTQDRFERDVKIVAESQQEVLQRTRMSLRRLEERFSFSDESYDKAVTHLKEAVEQMTSASEKLVADQLQEALDPEQLALQAILKAESESRTTLIQMARNQGSAGGGGQNQRERQDLRELFEMEMGRRENRYEIPRQAGARQQTTVQDETLKKLQELARRQERLNSRQRDVANRQDRMDEADNRRRLEELRREQEELFRRAEALSRQLSRSSSLTDDGPGGHHRQQLEQAMRQMREAARSLLEQNPEAAAAMGDKALENLRRPQREPDPRPQASVSGLLNDLSRKARQLIEEEERIQQSLREVAQRGSSPKAVPPPSDRQAVQTGKETLQRHLSGAKEVLRTIGDQGRQERPEIARRAVNTLRSLKSEKLEEQIRDSLETLRDGPLERSVAMEERIAESIHRVARRFQELDQMAPRSREERRQRAAADAGDLRQELEKLRQQVEALRNGNRQTEQDLSQRPNQEGADRLAGVRERLRRIQRDSERLIQPWASGESWAGHARSIHRSLTRKDIIDFLRQPELWTQLMRPVRELESALLAQAELSRAEKKLFVTEDEAVPDPYRQPLEEYYRALSESN